jgi:hypothetical protein
MNLKEYFENDTANPRIPWDRYDVYFFLFRAVVFLAVALTTLFFVFTIVANVSDGSMFGFCVATFNIGLWIFLQVGVFSYLVFFTRNTFRMYAENTLDDDEEESLGEELP